jgi:hypothetical protein
MNEEVLAYREKLSRKEQIIFDYAYIAGKSAGYKKAYEKFMETIDEHF